MTSQDRPIPKLTAKNELILNFFLLCRIELHKKQFYHFSSPQPKAKLGISDQILSLVCRRHRPKLFTFSFSFIFFSSTTLPISTKLCTSLYYELNKELKTIQMKNYTPSIKKWYFFLKNLLSTNLNLRYKSYNFLATWFFEIRL